MIQRLYNSKWLISETEEEEKKSTLDVEGISIWCDKTYAFREYVFDRVVLKMYLL